MQSIQYGKLLHVESEYKGPISQLDKKVEQDCRLSFSATQSLLRCSIRCSPVRNVYLPQACLLPWNQARNKPLVVACKILPCFIQQVRQSLHTIREARHKLCHVLLHAHSEVGHSCGALPMYAFPAITYSFQTASLI
jgi:hypothetical protein